MGRVVFLRFSPLFFVLSIGTVAFAQDSIAISGTIRTRVDGTPVPGAVVSVISPLTIITSTADVNGKYALEVPRTVVRDGRIQISVETFGMPPKIVDVAVEGPTQIADVAVAIGFSEQVTVGSRAVGAESEKAVPVDFLTREQIAA